MGGAGCEASRGEPHRSVRGGAGLSVQGEDWGCHARGSGGWTPSAAPPGCGGCPGTWLHVPIEVAQGAFVWATRAGPRKRRLPGAARRRDGAVGQVRGRRGGQPGPSVFVGEGAAQPGRQPCGTCAGEKCTARLPGSQWLLLREGSSTLGGAAFSGHIWALGRRKLSVVSHCLEYLGRGAAEGGR